MQNFDPAKIVADIAALKSELATLDVATFNALAAKVSEAIALLQRLEQYIPMLAKQFETEIAGVGAAQSAGVIEGEAVGVHADPPAAG